MWVYSLESSRNFISRLDNYEIMRWCFPVIFMHVMRYEDIVMTSFFSFLLNIRYFYNSTVKCFWHELQLKPQLYLVGLFFFSPSSLILFHAVKNRRQTYHYIGSCSITLSVISPLYSCHYNKKKYSYCNALSHTGRTFLITTTVLLL